jgi:glutamate synthase (NADPH/NADH) large chain
MEAHYQHLLSLVQAHHRATHSAWGMEILNDYRSYAPKFWLVKPKAADVDSLIENLRRAA